jgi:hypothetical protein
MNWSDAFRPCALAALVGTILMSLGLYTLVAMLAAGFLAVVFYRQRRPGILIRAGSGARLGALAGLLWFGMSSVLGAIVVLVLHKGPELQKALLTMIDQQIARSSDPQATAMFERLKTPEGLQVLLIFGIIFTFIFAIAVGALSGALAGKILGRRNKS